MDEKKFIILVSDRGLSRGKYAAAAVHAALLAQGVHPGVPVIVLGASPSEIEKMDTRVYDAGRTEVEPGTLTAGTNWVTKRQWAKAIVAGSIIGFVVGSIGGAVSWLLG